MTTYFTSDLHLGHSRVIEYSKRPFRDADEMNEELVRRWNARVRPGDTVYVLGDVSFCGLDKTVWLLGRMQGAEAPGLRQPRQAPPQGAEGPGDVRVGLGSGHRQDPGP